MLAYGDWLGMLARGDATQRLGYGEYMRHVGMYGGVVIGDRPPGLLEAPALTGTAEEGEALTTDNGSWSRDPTGYTRQWQISPDGVAWWEDASGETSTTFTPVTAEANLYARAKIVAENAVGFSIPAYSGASARIKALRPAPDDEPDISGGLPAEFTEGAWAATIEGGSSGDPGAYQAIGTAVFGTGAVTPSWPTHAAGDVALLFIECNEAGTIALDDAQGFTEAIAPVTSAFALTKLGCYVCKATDSSMAAPTVADSGNHTMAVIITFRGVDGDNPINAIASGSSGGTNPASAPSVTTTAANCLIVNAFARHNLQNAAQFSSWTNANLTDLTERYDAGTVVGDGGGIGIATGLKATAGATGATTAVPAGSFQVAGITVALNPAGAVGGTEVPTQGTWFLDFTTGYDSSLVPNGQLAIHGGDEAYILYNRGGKWGAYVANGSIIFLESDLPAVIGDRIRVAFRLKDNDFALAFNGQVTSKDEGGTVPAVSTLNIGEADFNGTIHALEFYATDLTDEQLCALTQPPADPGVVWTGSVAVPDDFLGIFCHAWPTNAEGGAVSAEPTYAYGIANSVDHNGMQWRQLQPNNAASRDWTTLDAWADANKAKGAKLMFCQYGTPTSLAQAAHAGKNDPYGYPGGGSPPDDLDDLADWITALVSRCLSRGVPLDYLQIGNEWAEDGVFWEGTWEDIAAYTRVAAAAAKAADPNITIISNGLANADDAEVYLEASDGASGTAADHIDGLAHNPFGVILPEGLGNTNGGGLDHTLEQRTMILRASMVAGGLASDFPIYGTGQAITSEVGHAILGAWPELMKAQYVARVCLRMMTLGWRSSIWYSHDDDLFGNPSESNIVADYMNRIGSAMGKTITEIYLYADGRYRATFSDGSTVIS